jgi:flagellar hook assembly protein FlgD
VRVLFDGQKSMGIYTQLWDTRNDAGQMVSSGVYMYHMEATSDNGQTYIKTRKMVLLR